MAIAGPTLRTCSAPFAHIPVCPPTRPSPSYLPTSPLCQLPFCLKGAHLTSFFCSGLVTRRVAGATGQDDTCRTHCNTDDAVQHPTDSLLLCFCSVDCIGFGDCCPGYAAFCSGTPATLAPTTSEPTTTALPRGDSCAGQCGARGSGGGCSCDVGCAVRGACCGDFVQVCLLATAAPTISAPTPGPPTTSEPTPGPTPGPTTSEPTTANTLAPTTSEPTTSEPTTSEPTTSEPTAAPTEPDRRPTGHALMGGLFVLQYQKNGGYNLGDG